MQFDYFYGPQADQFSFYRVPKLLFVDEQFKDLSAEAKTLYGVLLDRVALSIQNHWIDDEGKVYIIFTINEVMEALSCGNKKAGRLLQELSQFGLIERKRQGLNRPNLLYVKNFISAQNGHFLKCQNDTSGNVKTTLQEMSKRHASNTDKNNTDMNKTYLSYPSDGYDEIASAQRLNRSDHDSIFREQLDIDAILHDSPNDAELVEELLGLIVDTYCSSQKQIRIGRDDKPAEVVRSQFMKLTAEHIRYVIKCLHENTVRIGNIRQYLLASLYNAPLTMSGYYDNLVNHDFAKSSSSQKIDLYSSEYPYEEGSTL